MSLRAYISRTLAAAAFALGLLIALPTITYNNSIWVIQMLLSEFSWIVGLVGASAVALESLGRRRSAWTMLPSAFGIFWALVPFWQTRIAVRYNDAAMREGLGSGYLRAVPPPMRARMRQRRWSLETSLGQPGPLHRFVRVEPKIVYQSTPQRSLMLDIYHPLVPPARGDRYPAIVTLHGGSWRYGDKGGVFAPHHRSLASQGYVVFDIQYRLADQAAYPAALEDVRAAVRWVKRYADAYQVDTDRIALMGRSAGGHLALLAAYRADEPEAAGTDVQAVVALYPPTDLRMWYAPKESDIAVFLGGTPKDRADNYAAVSVVDHVRPGIPPTLLAQGYRDDLVFPAHVELLQNRLSATGTPAVVLRYPWARHGFDAFVTGLGGQYVQYDIDRFLAWALFR